MQREQGLGKCTKLSASQGPHERGVVPKLPLVVLQSLSLVLLQSYLIFDLSVCVPPCVSTSFRCEVLPAKDRPPFQQEHQPYEDEQSVSSWELHDGLHTHQELAIEEEAQSQARNARVEQGEKQGFRGSRASTEVVA